MPPATKLGQGYVFTRAVILFTAKGGGDIPACIAGGIAACLTAGIQWGMVSQHALQASRPTPREEVKQSGRGVGGRGVPRPTPKGEVEGSGLGGGSPGPHPGGSPGPHPGGLQAHTWGEGSQGPHPRGFSRPTLGGVSQHALRQPPPDGYCCGRYTSYWNAFLFTFNFYLKEMFYILFTPVDPGLAGEQATVQPIIIHVAICATETNPVSLCLFYWEVYT